MTKQQSAERDEVIADLRETLKPGDTIHTVLRHRSRSGIMRAIDLYLFKADNDGKLCKWWLSWRAAKALGWTFSDKYDALIVDGCGMDMGFHAVYSLSRILFPDGFDCLGDASHCPANDHHNIRDRAKVPHHHNDGGYALRHEWI